MRTFRFAVPFSILALAGPAADQADASAWFPVAATAQFGTGDGWTDRGVAYRLYGVQACLRGTAFTNAAGVERDCGEASVAMLVALVRDLRPRCRVAVERPSDRAVFVVCVAQSAGGAGQGSRIDLGTALIASGYAFAALDREGRPLHAPYFVAQLAAERRRAGLWAFADLPVPTIALLRVLRGREPSAASPPIGDAAEPSVPAAPRRSLP